jgi:PAS domain S-box-containing protein
MTQDDFSRVFTHNPIPMWIFSQESRRIIAINDAATEQYGYSRAELLELTIEDLHPARERAWVREHLATLGQRSTRAGLWRHQRKNGAEIDVEVSSHALQFNGVAARLVLAHDVSSRNEAFRRLQENEQRLELAIQGADMGMWDVHLPTRVLHWSPAYTALFGLPPQAAPCTAPEFYNLVVTEDREQLQDAFNRAIAEASSFHHEFRIRWPDGSIRWHSARGRVAAIDGRAEWMIGVGMDVTAHRAMEDALRESEERFRQVVESIDEVFWVSSTSGQQLLYVSPKFERIWGRQGDELGRLREVWSESLHPDDRARVESRFAGVREPVDESYRIIRPDRHVRWIRHRAFPVRDATGEVVRLVGVAEDVTERKDLERQFLHAQRLEAIGTLASGVAHDLNNILAPLIMVPAMLHGRLASSSDEELLALMEGAAKRGADIVRQLLTFSRGVEGERGFVAVGDLLREMGRFARETFPRDIEIAEEIPADVRTVLGNTTHLHQVLMNLCVNARDAMPGGGRLSLSAGNRLLTDAEAQALGGLHGGSYVALAIGDTGTGIPLPILDRIFEPFFTTKDVGKGTGLGLSTVLGIVKSHGGFVRVETKAGAGSTFNVFLPSADQPAAIGAPDEKHPGHGRGELILLVDDEQPILKSMRRFLEKSGYSVVTASDGREALDVLGRRRADIQMLVTDLMMPTMNGAALIAALRATDPDLPIIVTSGNFDASSREQIRAAAVQEVLNKPLLPATLLTAIARHLRARR